MRSTSHESDSIPLFESQTVSSFLTKLSGQTLKSSSESPKIKRVKTVQNNKKLLTSTPISTNNNNNNNNNNDNNNNNSRSSNSTSSHKKMTKTKSPKKRSHNYIAASSSKQLKFQNETEIDFSAFCQISSDNIMSISDYTKGMSNTKEMSSKSRHYIASTSKVIDFNPARMLSSTPNRAVPESSMKVSEFSDYTTPNKPQRYRLSVSEFSAQINESLCNTNRDIYEIQQENSSVSDWMKNSLTISTVTSEELGESFTINNRSRAKKPISGGFAEYTQIIMRRLDAEVNLWNHNLKKGTHLENIDPLIILTVQVISIHNTASVYSAICDLIEPIPEKIRSNSSFQTEKKVTIIFSPRTLQYFEICPKSFMKICPPWTFLTFGENKNPVFLCTYFSFKIDTPQIEQPVHFELHDAHTEYTVNNNNNNINNSTVITLNLYKEVNFDDTQPHCTSTPLSPILSDNIISDVNLILKYNSLKNTIASQSWNSVSLAGTILYVTRPLNPLLLDNNNTLDMLSHLITDDQCVGVYLIDDKFLISLIFIPYMVIKYLCDELFTLLNKIVLFKSLKVLKRASHFTSPAILSVVDILVQRNSVKCSKQRYCYCLTVTDPKSILFLQSNNQTELSSSDSKMPLTKFENLMAPLADTKMARLSFIGYLFHIHSETPQKMEEYARTETYSGTYLFVLDESFTDTCQIYLDASFSSDLINSIRECLPQVMLFDNFYHCTVSRRPSNLNGDEYSNIMTLNEAYVFDSEIPEKASRKFTNMKIPQFPSLDSSFMLGTIVSLEGEIIDIDGSQGYSCNFCHQIIQTGSTNDNISVLCADCECHTSSPTAYHIVAVMSCSKLPGDLLYVQLQQNTIDKLIQTPNLCDKNSFKNNQDNNTNNNNNNNKVYKENNIRELLQDKLIFLSACFIRESLISASNHKIIYLEEILIP